MSVRVVEIRPGAVTKRDDNRGRMLAEARRTRAAEQVAEQAGIRVPHVMSATDVSVTFEYLPGLTSLEQVLSANPSRVLTELHRAGEALGRIHTLMQPPQNTPGCLPPFPASPNEHVGLHGDFVASNLARSTEGLVVLDWAPPDWLVADEMFFGPPEWDLALFLFTLHLRRPFDPRPIAHLDRAASAFLGGYRGVTSIDLRALPAFFRWVTPRALLNETGWPRRLSRVPQLVHGYARIRGA